MPGYLKSNDDIQKVITFVYAKGHLLYLFSYRPTLAISPDPKLLMQKINLINTNCKCIILGYKLKAICGLEIFVKIQSDTVTVKLYSKQ